MDYVTWANAETIHLLSYALDKNAEGPEPLLTVDRDGAKTEVLAAYPMFTAAEAEELAADVDRHVTFPTHTPWVGVLAPDGVTVLASGAKGTSKSYRAMYDAERKKLPPPLARDAWLAARKALDASAEAEFDERYAEATKAYLAARAKVPAPTPALAERLDARLAALETAGKAALARAEATKDGEARSAAVAKARADFAGLPFLAPAATAPPVEKGAPAVPAK
ncbi:MAG: hypothetical protein U1E39_07995 [Planctomycetota bacterium]